MFKFVCLLFLIPYQYCYGYPTKDISNELPGATEIQNSSDFRNNENNSDKNQNRSTNTSSSVKQHEFSKLVIKIQNIRGFIIPLEVIKQSNTTSNTTNDLQGVAKKVVTKVKERFKQVKDKVKEGSKQVKDKVKGGFKQVKDKVKVGIDKVKDKIDKIKDNIGSGGGTSGGGYGYRDNHRRDYKRPTSSGYSGGVGVSPTFLWVLLVLVVAGVIGTILYFVIKK